MRVLEICGQVPIFSSAMLCYCVSFGSILGFCLILPKNIFFRIYTTDSTVQLVDQNHAFSRLANRRSTLRKMSTEMYRHVLTTAFKNWRNLGVGAVLLR